ncbi:probable serine/threonine-protein kinase PBL26 [Chenopodium quinoa]|uniref:probable serine/threonine-protein kinase PBL26 n=1 Tax=Chenopodium quinoa TaxID=63459 RepID=UPI000B793E1D|nr:probable serine/threonine-protein kinase PBL26 [Chenopodium quinoa]
MDERSFGPVYQGKLNDTGEIVAVELWDRKIQHESQEHKEFLRQLKILSFLNHPNVITLIGYCIEGDQRILVCEYLSLTSSLYQHLHGRLSKQKPPLDWNTRMKIALGIARGLECIHAASPPIIYVDLKPCNIFIDDDFNAKLSDFWLSKLEPYDDDEYTCTTLIGIASGGYHAPEYIATGHLTVKADVYSFGVVLLELVTGRKAKDISRPTKEQDLISWAQQKIKNPNKFPELADPLLQGNFPANGFSQALVLAVKCLRLKESTRPMMSNVVADIMCLTSDELNDKRLV